MVQKAVLACCSSTLETGPVILFMDGHTSHINLELITLARDRGVILFCLPSHTTHALQPLDVGVYGPLKSRWGKILKEYKMETCAAVVDKTEFPGLLKKLWEESFEAKHLKVGFRKAGLCPLTTENISKSSFAPSLPHILPPHEPQTPTKGDQAAWADDTDTHLIHVQVKCCECFSEKQLTPVRIYLRGYLHASSAKRRQRGRRQHAGK